MQGHLNWKKYWDKKSEFGPLVSTGRSGSSISDLYLYIGNTINSLGGLNKKDTILDAKKYIAKKKVLDNKIEKNTETKISEQPKENSKGKKKSK